MSFMSSRGKRPLSPHLTIYKPIPTMVMSILHRLTGASLYFGTILFSLWLIAVASGPDMFAWVQIILGSLIGQCVLFGYSWALMHHVCGGIRHLIWDTGIGFEKHTANRMAYLTLSTSVIATILIWVVAYAIG